MTGPLVVTITFILAAVGLGTIITELSYYKPFRKALHVLGYIILWGLIGKEYAEDVAINKEWKEKAHSAGTENA
ncbi:hypothetical protein JK159_08360 [Weissella minor]|uniref:hypothetical protein n=1 Tax=Weissella minor TaxID=1620 RepID=UPI001BAF4514|nr:hypothetical protein [Weissella minor]MBS0950367.1 hypothetical protein [Weissella minor]